ncbi:hypothetical protein B4Q04_10935 [Zobellia sp. OII3]|uniref:hypothetical protein n=1 Tax=Zobellia sp. OII3 TaxID=2034520 RepID=UPI000B536E39|nr:hypothetical protein [Zobellia sp. OII3]OWW25055.1 hypothetical protein B4Q04_10935 [Zobellia sp. OII3]
MTYNKLGFAFVGLKTVSFAQIEAAYKKTGEVDLITNLAFGIDVNDHTITCSTKFSFEKKKDQPFLILELQGFFEINKNDFIKKVKQSDNSFLITKDLATHFAVLMFGSARGVLHAKTEGTIFNQYLLPTMDVKSMIQEDLVLNSSD